MFIMNSPQLKPYLFLCFFLFLCNEAISNEKTLINFQELDQIEARKAGKKIMVSFTADWCLPCKSMAASLYSDPEIADLVNSNFQPLLIDVDSPLGDSWHKSYNIDILPSILFTNASGIEFERLRKNPTKEEFLKTINRIINTEEVPYRVHNHTSADVVVSDATPSGRDIQLGAFSSFASAQRRVHALTEFKEESYFIIEEETKGKLLFKVIHSGLVSYDASIIMLNQYIKNGFEAFIRPQ